MPIHFVASGYIRINYIMIFPKSRTKISYDRVQYNCHMKGPDVHCYFITEASSYCY
jgi:hypothetical protein